MDRCPFNPTEIVIFRLKDEEDALTESLEMAKDEIKKIASQVWILCYHGILWHLLHPCYIFYTSLRIHIYTILRLFYLFGKSEQMLKKSSCMRFFISLWFGSWNSVEIFYFWWFRFLACSLKVFSPNLVLPILSFLFLPFMLESMIMDLVTYFFRLRNMKEGIVKFLLTSVNSKCTKQTRCVNYSFI